MKCYIMIVPSGSGPILGLPFVRAPVSKLQPGTSLFIAAEKALLEQSSVVRSCTLLHQRWFFFYFDGEDFCFYLCRRLAGEHVIAMTGVLASNVVRLSRGNF